MADFKIGDRVKIKPDLLSEQIFGFKVSEYLLNIPGTIVVVRNVFSASGDQYRYSIEFDEEMGGHTCNGCAKNHHGLYVSGDHIIPLDETDLSSITEDDLMGVLANDY